MNNMENIKRDFGLPPGDWQLISYGRLIDLPTIKAAIWVAATFRKVKLEKNLIVEWLSASEVRNVPAGEMILFDPGCVFSSETSKVLDTRFLSKDVIATEIEIEFTDENCQLIRRYGRNEYGQLLFNNSVSEMTENSNAFLLSAVCTNGKKILIPCTTVLQAFWGRSSKLLQMLLDTRFLNFDTYVINTSLSKFDEVARTAFLLLRQWSEDGDAIFLATIAFNKTAVKRGKNIALHICAQPPDFQNVEDRYIAAYPPHSTKVTLEVWGLPVQSKNFGDYLYIQRVIKSSYEPEFKSLVYDRDNDGRKGSQPENGTGDGNGADMKKPMYRGRKPGPPRINVEGKVELTSEPPGHESTSESYKAGSFDQMFPNISNIDAKKAPQLETEFFNDPEDIKVARANRWAKLLSVLPGTATSSSDAIKTTLESAKFVRDYTLDANTSDIKIYLSNLIDSYNDFNRNRENIAESMPIVKPRFPWPKSPAAGGDLVFSLPATIKERNIAWLYSNPERTKRKRAICLEVTFQTKNLETIGIGYIIDIEVRFPKPKISMSVDGNGQPKFTQNKGSTSMVFVWRASQELKNDREDNKISDIEFQEMLKAIAVHGGYTGAKQNFPKGCLTQARKHSANGISFVKLLEELGACVLGGQP